MKLEEFVLVKDYQLVHSHGPEGEHSHAWVVPQSWLSPSIARQQAAFCHKKIVEEYGQNQSLEDGFAKLQKRFDELDTSVEALRELHSEFVVATSSPEISYLTRELGWGDRYLQLNEDSSEAAFERMLLEMQARSVKDAPGPNAEAEVSETLFLWAGQATETLRRCVEQQWEAAVEIDLIETASDNDLDSNSYFERMAKNLKVIRAAIE